MSVFGGHLLERLDEMVEKHRVVVVYDPREEFRPLFERDLEEVGGAAEGLVNTRLNERTAILARGEGSFFDVKLAVEPVVSNDEPGRLVVYLPAIHRDRQGSPLMELEEGGHVWEPSLRKLARGALQAFFTDTKIDEMLDPAGLTYDDVNRYLESASRGDDGSILKAVLGSGSTEAVITRWLANDEHDAELTAKQAEGELHGMLGSRLGLVVEAGATISDTRRQVERYLLTAEFRMDLEGEVEALSQLPMPKKAEHGDCVREILDSLRRKHPGQYEALADRIEADLRLGSLKIDPRTLGSIDTFRFEEAALLDVALEFVADKDFEQASEIVAGRVGSFWVERDVARQAQWEVCGLAASLGMETARVRAELHAESGAADALVASYATEGGWFEVDRVQRRLETLLTRLSEEPQSSRALACVRAEYASLIQDMALRFSTALGGAGWQVPDALAQTDVYAATVNQVGNRVGYFLVDAMRFEMGAELASQLEGVSELELRPAVAVLPTITKIGMAALMPGAESSFSVVQSGAKLAAKVDGSALESLADRQRLLSEKVGDAADMTLESLLQLGPEELDEHIGGARLVVVRSQEIDAGGEVGNDLVGRAVMDTVMANVARGVRKLARAGVESFVITADHGHQCIQRKGDDMKTEAPAGETLELHRRCWVGRGGTIPAGAVRVSGAELGYETDLDFAFPEGLGVFKAGGGLSYHHGGLSLQEMIVPVLTCRLSLGPVESSEGLSVQLEGVPDAVTNRIFSASLIAVGDVLTTEDVRLRVTLLDGEQQVGEAKMATGSDVEPDAGVITIAPGTESQVVLMLSDDDCASLRIVVQDVDTDAVLAQSDELPVKLAV